MSEVLNDVVMRFDKLQHFNSATTYVASFEQNEKHLANENFKRVHVIQYK